MLGYVLTQLERQMPTDAPMFLLLDDAAVTWLTPRQERQRPSGHPAEAGATVSRLLMTTAKKEVSLGFSTHSLSQVFSSALGPLLEEGCPTHFFFCRCLRPWSRTRQRFMHASA